MASLFFVRYQGFHWRSMVAGSWPCVAGARFATLTGAKNSGFPPVGSCS